MLYACRGVDVDSNGAREVEWVSFLGMIIYSVEISWAYM